MMRVQALLRFEPLSAFRENVIDATIVHGNISLRIKITHMFKLFSIAVSSCFGLILVSAVSCYAQIEHVKVQILPPSPNAVSLGRYGDIPVSYYTGTPNVSIPIYELKGRDLTVPISVSYHSGGNKVEDIASWVGLGWTLNAGGAIVRMARGIPDEGVNGLPNSSVSVDDFFASTPSQKETYRSNSNRGLIDFEPDVFIFNFNGRSGKFFVEKLNNELVGYPTPYSDLKIHFASGEWTIVDEIGVKYFFGSGITDAILSISYSNESRNSLDIRNYTSAWYLKKILSPKGEEINFQYTPYFSSYCQRVYETKRYLMSDISSSSICASAPDSKSFSEIELTGSRLTKITSSLATIDFIPSQNERQDVNGDKALDRIIISDFDANVLKQFSFGYSYFESIGGLSSTYCEEGNQNSRNYRLRLDRLTEVSSDGVPNPPYLFEYDQQRLPDRLSNSMDHWGFYNGQNNPTLVPTYLYSTTDGVDLILAGANRAANPATVTAGIIKKITYPTGGSTEFEFEAHEAFVAKDFLFKEEFISPPLITFASLRARDARIGQADFSVSFPQIYPDRPAGAWFEVTVSGNCNLANKDGCGAQISIYNTVTNGGYFAAGGEINGQKTSRIFLPNGRYRLEIEAYNFSNPQIQNLRAAVHGPDPSHFVGFSDSGYNKKIGGTRIKRIKSTSGMGSPTIVKRFTYFSDHNSETSSGVMTATPIYNYCSAYGTCFDFVRTASSQASLATTQGSQVGYEFVQIYYGENGESGRELLQYTTSKQHPDVLYESFPFAPNVNVDWRRGLVLESRIQAIRNGVFCDVKMTRNYYQFFITKGALYRRSFDGIKMGCAHTGLAGNCILPVYTRYSNKAEWFFLSKTTSEDFSESNQASTLTKEYFFDRAGSHVQQTRNRTVSSDGKVLEYFTKYPFDFANSASPVIEYMKANHLPGVAIEQQEWRDGKIAKGQVNEYSILNGKPLLSGTYLLETSVALGDMNQNQQSSLFTDIVPDARYKKRVEVLRSDPATGNILEFKSMDGVLTSYKWGYQNNLPNAEVKNASESQIFHTSFEETGTIETLPLNPALTGRKYQNSGSFNFAGNGFVPTSTVNLKMSYWYWSNNKWNFSGVVTWNNSISAGTRLDEVRAFPGDSQMTTYTYSPGIGITSITDANNLTIHYKYDSFGRLESVRDNKGNIVKNYTYNLQGK